MIRHIVVPLFVALFVSACSSEPEAPAVEQGNNTPASPPAISDVATAMGLNGVDAITLSGTAWRIRNSFRQTLTASPPWPERDEIANYTLTIDLAAPALKATGDTFASNLFLETPVAGTHSLYVPATSMSWRQQMEIWLTPWGFIRGAEQFGASSRAVEMDGERYTRFTWTSPESQISPSGMPYTVNGYVNAEHLVVRTETWVEDAFMGDMHVVGVYDDYETFDGVMVPTTFEQQRGGGGIFGVDVSSATTNPGNLETLISAPPAPSGQGGGPGEGNTDLVPTDLTRQVGEGAWLVTGGYVALVVEFEDHLTVFEAGQSETRGEQILQQIRDNISAKPIRYIINSHPHSDHTAGLVPFIRAGATLVTHTENVDFLTMALASPRELLGEDSLQSEVLGVGGVGVLEDESNRIELHSVPNQHTDGMLVAVLPGQGILFQADFTLPPAGAEANPFVKTLARYVADNEVQFERYLAVHAANATQTRADLLATIGSE